MNTLTKEEFKTLTAQQADWCVSIHMPMHRSAMETQSDRLRLKHLLDRAEKQMLANGVRSIQVDDCLEPARQILQDNFFWRHPSAGLAIFLAPQFARHYRVPLDLGESLLLSRQFHLKPLMPLLGDDRYYVLALSQNQVKLYQGTRFGVGEVELRNVPANFADALKEFEVEKERDYHQLSSPVGAGRIAVSFGNAAGVDDHKMRLLEYFRKIDHGLHEMFGNQRVPLVLAGVDYLFPIYLEANTYPHLLYERIAGSPKDLSAKYLHARAWAIVQPQLAQKQVEALVRYGKNIGSERVSSEVKQIVPIAYQGRVELLFVTRDLQLWGKYDAETNQTHLHKQMQPGDDDLLNLAAIQTFLHGGQVHLLEQDHMPEHVAVAAMFRQ